MKTIAKTSAFPLSLLGSVCLSTVFATPSLAQLSNIGNYGGYAPVVVISRSVTAQSDIIRSWGDSYESFQQGNLNYARARKELADAVDKELDNYLKYARTYFDRRLENEQKKMELREVYENRKDEYAIQRENGRKRLLDTLLKDPELAGPAIDRGLALNKLLERFYNTPIAYGIHLGPSIEEALGDRMDLSPTIFNAIWVQSSGSGSKFRLTEPMSLDVTRWPDMLRAPQYDSYRMAVETQREKLLTFAKPGKTVPVSVLNDMEVAVGNLMQAFFRANPPGARRGMPTEFVRAYLQTEEFLAGLDRDLRSIQNSGIASSLGSAKPFDPEVDGRDLPALISWMIRSGLSFAPASRGDEPVYRGVFTRMRDLYTQVAE
jgi:hypothetical protein